MKISIFYFSQTGNTLKVAEAMAEEFRKESHTVEALSIKDPHALSVIDSDIIGIGVPTFESHAPAPVKEFIKQLPKLTLKPVFLFATGGGASGNVFSDLSRLLKKKGTHIVGTFFTLGEVSHPAPCIQGKAKGHPNREDLLDARDFACSLLKQSNSKSHIIHGGIKPKKGFYNIVGAISSSDTLIRILEPKPKHCRSKCSKCKLCLSHCPMDNIEVKSNLKIGNKCIRCYHCMGVCPNSALSVNWWYGNLVVTALWNRHFMKWFGEYDGS